MDLKPRNKVSTTFSMSGMTDIIFLLLIFFMVTSTLINPNALKLLLPKSSSQTAASPVVSVSITSSLNYYVGSDQVKYSRIEYVLKEKFREKNVEEPTISLNADRRVPIEEVVKIMNIANRNQWKLILATTAD
ncbi:MAG TPA: biopolymer transporter ExbD [Bacteroidales bacterium]|nr:biopolymer transporter ExbD [Bacteroidales bacterium]